MPSKSKSQQKAAGMALSAKKGKTKVSELKGSAKSMYKMKEKDLEDFAKSKHKKLPKKVKKINEGIETLDEYVTLIWRLLENKGYGEDELDNIFNDEFIINAIQSGFLHNIKITAIMKEIEPELENITSKLAEPVREKKRELKFKHQINENLIISNTEKLNENVSYIKNIKTGNEIIKVGKKEYSLDNVPGKLYEVVENLIEEQHKFLNKKTSLNESLEELPEEFLRDIALKSANTQDFLYKVKEASFQNYELSSDDEDLLVDWFEENYGILESKMYKYNNNLYEGMYNKEWAQVHIASEELDDMLIGDFNKIQEWEKVGRIKGVPYVDFTLYIYPPEDLEVEELFANYVNQKDLEPFIKN